MDKFHRYNDLLSRLKARRTPIKLADLAEQMECNPATVKRIVAEMRDYLDAPILSSHDGYHLDPVKAQSFELPGVWFSASELVALLTMQQVLSGLRQGVLSQEFDALRLRIDKLLRNRKLGSAGLINKVKALMHGIRGRDLSSFKAVAESLATEQQLQFSYGRRDQRSQDKALEKRQVSPQRLLYYRGNLYLQAWCHQRADLRSFALERMTELQIVNAAIVRIPETQLEQSVGVGYGIFSGPAPHVAILKFSADAASWVADEIWHPTQTQRWLEDGALELCVPYGNPTELLMDIARHGPDVEVLAPAELRLAIAQRLQAAAAQYV